MPFCPLWAAQTALNLCMKADEWESGKSMVFILLVLICNTIEITENREKFRKCMQEIGVGTAPSAIANSFLEGKEIAQGDRISACNYVLLIHLVERVLLLFTYKR